MVKSITVGAFCRIERLAKVGIIRAMVDMHTTMTFTAEKTPAPGQRKQEMTQLASIRFFASESTFLVLGVLLTVSVLVLFGERIFYSRRHN